MAPVYSPGFAGFGSLGQAFSADKTLEGLVEQTYNLFYRNGAIDGIRARLAMA